MQAQRIIFLERVANSS